MSYGIAVLVRRYVEDDWVEASANNPADSGVSERRGGTGENVPETPTPQR